MRIFKPVRLTENYDHLLEGFNEIERVTCVGHHKTEQADLHPNGFPESFVLDNTAIRQRFFTREEVDFDLLGKQVGVEVISVSVIKQEPGNVIPIHRDMFYKISQEHPQRVAAGEEMVRANMFLTDWKAGQYLEFDEEPFTKWEKGTGFLFNKDVLHLSSNAGAHDKYTMQISGFYHDNTHRTS